MKKSIASVISVAGVLGAGAAAYAVNTSVLTATSSNNLVAATAPVQTFGQTMAPAVASNGGIGASGIVVAPPTGDLAQQAPATTAPVSSQTTATPIAVAPLSSTPVAASSLTTYKVGTAGAVVIDAADSRLAVASATPAAGWTARKIVHSNTHSEVVFSSSTMTVYFEATLSNGSVSTSVRSEAVAPPVTSRPPRHDDDDNDDHDHEEHHDDDDDHHDEDD
ncbi:MAG: hypothetical protein RLY50_792 [Actinomycetota bacterium]|jgi:hypothetical protein